MTSLKNKHDVQGDYDLYGDVEKIKAALMAASNNMKGKAGEILSDSFDSMKVKTKAATDDVTSYVNEQPLKSLGIALLVGIAIGYILHK